MRKTPSFASCPYSGTCKWEEPHTSVSVAPLERRRATCFLSNLFSASPGTTEGKPKISHLGCEQRKWMGKKIGGETWQLEAAWLQCLCLCPCMHTFRKGSTSNGTEPEPGLNGSWISAHGFASVCYFCCWTPLNLFDLEVTHHLPSWEQNSSARCDLDNNLSYNGREKGRHLLKYIYVSMSKDQVYKITGLLYQYDRSL